MSVSTFELFGLSQGHLAHLPNGRLLHVNAIDDFNRMCQAARADGIEITIASSFRDFSRQQQIWDNKFNGLRPVLNSQGETVDMTELSDWQKVQAILRYSALPGTSRHHWGSDIDVYDTASIDTDYALQLEPSEYGSNGPFYVMSTWLAEHGPHFNFYRPYLEDLGGTAPELWHISHKPTAVAFVEQFELSYPKLLTLLNEHNVSGHQIIAEYFEQVLEAYVFSVPR